MNACCAHIFQSGMQLTGLFLSDQMLTLDDPVLRGPQSRHFICVLAFRPLKAQVHNCQLLVDLASRNALWGAAAHLFMAFKPLVPALKPAAPSSPRHPQGSALHRGTSGLHRGPSGLQRGHSGLHSPRNGVTTLTGQTSFTHQGNCSLLS